MQVEQLCNGDITRPIKVDVFDWSRTGKHELIGFATTSVEELSLKTDGHTFVLLNPAVQGTNSIFCVFLVFFFFSRFNYLNRFIFFTLL